ncbi:adenylate kinase family protein [Kitasatospora indigofera]|uniref:adenylate kinase family protein n=1 Tax=Kitasatospora indigofera TaxID=67307 RepID=UPI00367DDCB7
MRVVILEPTTWAWETPGASLARYLAVPRITFGDLVREHMQQGTGLGLRTRQILDSGGPFPDELRAAIVRERLCRAADEGFLLAHHPFTAAQALTLDELLLELGAPLDAVLSLRLHGEGLERHVRREAAGRARFGEPACSHRPAAGTLAAEGPCDVCGDDLRRRRADEENTLHGHLGKYEVMVEPVTRHYAERGLLVTVDVVGTPEGTADRALTALRQRIR